MSIEAMKLALEALKKARRKILTTEECHAATMAVSQAIEQAKKQEPETCMGCNGNGVVGNVLDTDICPFCKGSGVEQAKKQEPVAWMYKSVCGNDFTTRTYPPSYAKNIRPLYTSPPLRQPLTDEQKVALCKQFPDHLTFNAIQAVEAAHNIKVKA